MNDLIYYGVVEERDSDPLRLGRCKVRIIGEHTEDTQELPTADLPWAYPLMHVNSASISGIGYAPVGIVEGTIVAIVFRDSYKQHPLIIGTLPGIPEEIETYSTTSNVSEVFTETVVTDSSGNPVLSSEGTPVTVNNPASEKKVTTTRPGGLTLSKIGRNWIKNNEQLASLSPTGLVLGNTATPDATKIYTYKDVDRFAIGYGLNFINGTQVPEGLVITKKQADEYFDEEISKYVDAVNKGLKVPVTQSMFDAIVDMSYNMGQAGLFKSSFWSTLNNGNYEEAMSLIPVTRATVKGKPNAGLTNRRNKERNKFIEDGIPSKDLTKIEPSAFVDNSISSSKDATTNPAVLKPVVFNQSTTTGSNDVITQVSAKGFRDPKGVYPRVQFLHEPDTHRLARHENIDQTIVAKKESARVVGVPSAFGMSWNQPLIPYNALYPYNQVYVSESGHIEEFDDTVGNERTHRYHTSGSFEEIDRNGTCVRRIVGDDYEILERNGYILVKGNCNITIQGNSNIRVENDANIQVLGNQRTEVTGDCTYSVGGAFKVKAGSIQIDAESGNIDMVSEGSINQDAANIYLNSGVSTPSGLSRPSEQAKGTQDFPELVVPERTFEFFGNYESEEEGDPTTFIENLVSKGVINKDEYKPQANSIEDVTPDKKQKMGVVSGKKFEGPFSSSTKIFNDWTLGNVCKGRSGIPNSTNYGLTPEQIVSNLALLTEHIIDPIKKMFPNMVITNTWRSEEVNNSLPGSSKTSDHLKGCAVDIDFSGFTKKQKFDAIVEIQKRLPIYNQILLEYSGPKMWLHASFRSPEMGGNKGQVMTIDVMNKANNRSGLVLYGAS